MSDDMHALDLIVLDECQAERDSLRAQVATLTAERDKARAERDEMVNAVIGAPQNVAVIAAVAEQIAAWLEATDVAWNDDGFDESDGDISAQTATLIVREIRANAWRSK